MSKRPLMLKIAVQPWVNASRDKRELSAAREAGYDVCVMAKGDEGDKFRKDSVEGFDVYRFTTRPLGDRKQLLKLNRVLSIFSWAHYARKLHADVISGHDIIALLIGYLSCWYKPKNRRPKLVYDSHEFELGRSADRSKLTLFWIKHLERFLIRRCAFSIMVNDGIADEVARIHRMKIRPLVVRSTPGLWTVDEAVCRQIRNQWLERMNQPQDTLVLMYHGYIMQNRGLEMMLEVLAKTRNAVLIMLGDTQDLKYRDKILQLSSKLAITDRTLFLPAVPQKELWKYVGAADVGLIIHPAATRNYHFVLPNKFFENIQAETPVICSNLPELARLVNQYDIGLLVDPDRIEIICGAVEELRSNRELYKRFKDNLINTKKDLCWENERHILINAYSKLLSGEEK